MTFSSILIPAICRRASAFHTYITFLSSETTAERPAGYIIGRPLNLFT